VAVVKFAVTVGDTTQMVEVSGEAGTYRLTIGSEVWEVDGRLTAQGIYSLLIGGVSYVADVFDEDGACVVDVGAERYVVNVEEHTRYIIRTKGGAGGGAAARTLVAPLPGRIVKVAVKPGDRVEKGATLLVIEAMKMENEFKAGASGTIAEVRVEPGQAVNGGDVLIVIR
jgi:glutaconyl-CoA/methylmalonyl-CoA decarboxylase subunit gamma